METFYSLLKALKTAPRSFRCRNTVKTSDSAIGKHLLDNSVVGKVYNDDIFQEIGIARSSFHQAVLESIYIQTKSSYCIDSKSSFFLLDSSVDFPIATRY